MRVKKCSVTADIGAVVVDLWGSKSQLSTLYKIARDWNSAQHVDLSLGSDLAGRHPFKIALFCNVRKEHVISAPDVGNIYELPLVFFERQLDTQLLDILKIWTGKANLGPWRGMLKRWKNPQHN